MNFSPDITFHYNTGNRTINACERKQKNNFLELLGYNNIYNTTAIIGENGSGKSTISRFFIKLQYDADTFPVNNEYIIIFYKNNRYRAFTNIADSLQMNCSNLKIECILEDSFKSGYPTKLEAAFKDNVVINFTEAFNPSRYHELISYNSGIENDYSVEGRIARYKKKYLKSERNVDPIMFYHNKQVEEQIKVINVFSKEYGFPKQISIEVIKDEKFETQLKKDEDDIIDVNAKLNELRALVLSKYKHTQNNLTYFYHGYGKGHGLLRSLIDHLLRKMLLCLNIISDKKKKCGIIIQILNEIIERIEKMGENVSFEDIMVIIDIIVQKSNNPVLVIDSAEKEAYNKVLRFLCESSDGLSYRDDIDIYLFQPTPEKSWDELVEFYDAHAKTTFNGECPYLKFSWGMSTGEMAQLNLFAVVNDVVKKKENKNADITFFFDEAGLYWHPRWQQEGLKRILDVFNKANKNMQLILATHSPIFLSDFPKSDTYWLPLGSRKQEDCLETFGANIYNLYNNSFLWHKDNNSLLVTGEFSKSVIKEIASRLLKLADQQVINDQEKRGLEILKNDIEQIGEDIFRRDLLYKWEEVYSNFFVNNAELNILFLREKVSLEMLSI